MASGLASSIVCLFVLNVCVSTPVENEAKNLPSHLDASVPIQILAQSEASRDVADFRQDEHIYYITAMFNRGPLFDYCISSMTDLHNVDQEMTWIVVDYGTPGRDVRQMLKESGIRYQYIQMDDERFSRTLGLQMALDAVPREDALVFALDLVHVPTDLGKHTRRNVVQGKLVYTPIMYKLFAGQPVGSTEGHWYDWSWGIIGFYKSDAVKFGSYEGCSKGKMDLFKWGCEDVYFAEKFAEFGLKAVRLHLEGLIHYTLTEYEKEDLSRALPEMMKWKEYNNGRNEECLHDHGPITSIVDAADVDTVHSSLETGREMQAWSPNQDNLSNASATER